MTNTTKGAYPTSPATEEHDAIGWGILGTGKIARGFAADLRQTPGATVAAVGSRSSAAAQSFVVDHGEPSTRAHASYADLVADPSVDVVYIASPHALHLDHARAAFAAGKPVLCEKPLTLNTRDAEEMIRLAGQRGLFVMEAMWMACHPVIREVLNGVRAGRFGTPRQVHADLGFIVRRPPTDRILDPALGGGALLDMGIYPLTLAHLVLGEPVDLVATATLTDQGVDRDVAIAARYADGGVAALTASMSTFSPRMATIATDAGRIDLTEFHHPTHATFHPADGSEPITITSDQPLYGTGLGNEAAEVMRCVRGGLLESPLVPHAQTLSLMGQMDRIRAQIGVRYAADR
ncbi:MAG: Gfo/Idh/MocA family protein [Nocardioides sp.]